MNASSRDVELKLLSTLIAQPDLIEDLPINKDDFDTDTTQKIFLSLQIRHDRGEHIDSFVMLQAMAGKVDQDIIVTVCDSTYAEPWAVHEHARLVREYAIRRRINKAAYHMLEVAQTAEKISDAEMADIEKSIEAISAQVITNTGPKSIQDVMQQHREIMKDRYNNRGKLTGIDTGFDKLNDLLGGWKTNHMSIIAARPSVGKTAFAVQSAIAVAREDYCMVFSIEMSEETLADRMLANHGSVPLFNIVNGMILNEQWEMLDETFDSFSDPDVHLEIDESSNVTVAYIRSKVRKFMRHIPPGKKTAVFIDYLQLIKSTNPRHSKYEAVSEVSQELKAMAKELGCAVIALAQLNRANEQRQEKEPMMSDIRDSGQVEQDADVIMFLHRDDYYEGEQEVKDKDAVEVIVKKNRNGPRGTVKLKFRKEIQRFFETQNRPALVQTGAKK